MKLSFLQNVTLLYWYLFASKKLAIFMSLVNQGRKEFVAYEIAKNYKAFLPMLKRNGIKI